MGKVLDITERLKQKNSDINNQKESPVQSKASILDLTALRQEKIQSDRRDLRRTILSEFIGAFIVVPDRGLLKVTMYDISEDGMAFEVDINQGSYQKDERIAMRIYLNHKSYFEFVVQLRWSETFQDWGFIRQGGKFVKNTVNDEALSHFVKFIEAVSVNLKADVGDLQISGGS